VSSSDISMNHWVRRTVIGLAFAAATVVAVIYLRYEDSHPSTDDAHVDVSIVEIVPQVSGPIVDLLVEDNQAVEAGDVLFRIDPRPFQIAVDNARAAVDKTGQSVSGQVDSVASAEAQVERAQAALRLAEVQFQRIEPLAKQGALPLQDRDKAQAQLDGARSSLSKAKSQLKKAEDELGESGEQNADTRIAVADLENALLQLSYTEVKAPVNGFVTQLELSLGSYASAGNSLLSLVNSDSWRIVAYMREDQLAGIEPGQRTRIYLPAYPKVRFDGVVQGIGWGIELQDGAIGADGLPSVNPTVDWVRLAQRFPVRIALVQPDAAYPLRKGMTATIRIEVLDRPPSSRDGSS
jgi:multidrug efflux system membrane fusion protein